jgi:primosomal protein N' (replication factor Y)
MVYNPVRPQMERLKGMERGYILMQSKQRSALQQLLKTLVVNLRGKAEASKVRWAFDVDPLEF